jgi:heptosyltransferase II
MTTSPSKALFNKLLVIRFGALGDILQLSPSLHQFQALYPEADIHFLTAPLYPEMLNAAFPCGKIWTYNKKEGWLSYLKLIQKLKAENYTGIVNLHPSFRTWVLEKLLGINQARISIYKKEKFKVKGEALRHQSRKHATEDFWTPFEALHRKFSGENVDTPSPNIPFIPSLSLTKPASPQEASIPPKKKTLGIIPGVGSKRSNRAWPLAFYKALITRISAETNHRILLFGGHDERDLAESLCISPQVENHCGQHSILETAQLMAHCSVIVGGDTGPLHLASAVGTPLISLYGPTSLQRTGPMGHQPIISFTPPEDLTCWPCELSECPLEGKKHLACMNGISVLDVYQTIQKQMNGRDD